ncbi:Phosphatidylinositolglycan class N-domain-containing protein [Infundibulicybe gibba]|nr:Phosphatidylinositolglycan class N-domain-containing protein [Infundibulicybe gibba]
MERYNVGSAESKRLVLIVADGLRADLLFNVNPFPTIQQAPEIIAPHLRSIVNTRGAFGISHTRVPTESRPGHVAIIGSGMYEDVSAVTKGWKANPVDFDSVFNQSSSTFSFGSPDILPMFSTGAIPGRVKTWSYHEEDEDFTKDATALDIWVLDHLRLLFKNATMNAALDSELRSEKVIFFLHLLGLDTTGHSYRPHSQEYMNNIRVVDSIVRQTEELFSEFYQDEETAFIFTADHGMSTIGNHGDGHPDNTRTPLIAWGKGVRGPLPDSTLSSHDSYSEPWKLGHLLRRDVEQADIASLMASLVGIDWPINSVGVLPDVDPTRPGYLNPRLGEETQALSSFVNAKVILEHYRVKHDLKQKDTIFYKPYRPLEGSSAAYASSRIAQVTAIEQSISQKNWHAARKQSAELIRSSLAGLHYLQTYDRSLIRAIVTAAYTGWAAYASLFIFRPGDTLTKARSTSNNYINFSAIATLVVFWVMFAIQKSSWMFYVYISFPVYFWHQFTTQVMPVFRYWLSSPNQSIEILPALSRIGLTVVFLQGMVVAYTHRSIWSVGFLLIGVAWPLLFWSRRTLSRLSLYAAAWALVCIITGIFPLLTVDKTETIASILLGGTLMLATGFAFALSFLPTETQGGQARQLFLVQGVLIILTMIITTSSSISLQAKLGLPALNQISGWFILVIASTLPFVSRVKHANPWSKLLMYYLGFGPCFVILSISVEGLFYVAYSATLMMWIVVESAYRQDAQAPRSKTYQFQPDDLRIAVFFLFFVQVGFFGTGNVASISSFYLEPVYRLIPIFSPFFMAALLIFKIIAPYIILSVAFAILNHRLHLPPFSLFLVALALTDGMTLTFFFNVSDTGSWLEIGQSISFFCITSLLLLWSAGICAAGEYLMSDVFVSEDDQKIHKVE